MAPHLLTILLSLSALAAPAQDRTGKKPPSPALAERLPANTALFLRIASLQRAAEEIRTLAPSRIWQEEEVQAFWSSIREKVMHGNSSGEAVVILDALQELGKTYAGAVSVVVVPPGAAGQSGRKQSEGPMRHCAVVFEGCTSDKPADLVIDHLAAGPLRGILKGRPAIEQVGGVKLRKYPHPTSELFAAGTGELMVLSQDRELVLRLCRADGAGKADKSPLSATAEFVQAWSAAASSDPTLFAFGNFGTAVDDLKGRDKTEVESAGVDNVRAVALTLKVKGGEALDRITFYTRGGRKGFLRAIAQGPTKAAAAKVAPASTVLMSVMPVDLCALHAAGKEMEARSRGMFVEGLTKLLLGQYSLRLDEDLLQPLGKELTFLVMLPAAGALVPEFALLAEARNEAALQKALGALVTDGMKMELKETSFGGHVIRFGSVKEGRMSRASMVNMSPAYSVAGGYLVVGSHPNAVKRVLGTIDGKSPSLEQDDAFKKAVTRAMSEGAPAGLVYFNTRRTFEWLHGISTPILGMVGGRDLPFDPASIPTAECVSKHLSVAVNALRLGKESMEIRSFSDGMSLTSLITCGFGFAMIVETRKAVLGQDGSSRQCHQNLERISQKIEIFRKAHGHYPAKSDEIWGDHLRAHEQRRNAYTETCFADPEVKGGKAARDLIEGRILSYAYFPEEANLGKRESFPHDTILLYERKPFHSGCRLVVYAGGASSWLPEAEFQKKLAAQSGAAKPSGN